MKIAVIGRGTSAKEFAERINSYSNMSFAQISTTDKTVSADDFNIVDMEDISQAEEGSYPVSWTENGNLFFLTKENLEYNNVFVIAPTKLNELLEAMPDTSFGVVYVNTQSEEEDIYSLFKKNLDEKGIESLPINCSCLREISSKGADEEKREEACAISNTIRYHNNLMNIIHDGIKHKYIAVDESGKIPIMVMKPDQDEPKEDRVSIDNFASYMMLGAASEMFQYIMSQYLAHVNLPASNEW